MKVVNKTPIPIVVVTSGSMEPTIYEGDILFVKNISAGDIQVGNHTTRTGDVIVFETQGAWTFPIDEPVVHRVVNVSYNAIEGRYYFVTWGDHNPSPDNGGNPIPEDNLYGKVVGKIPKLGWVKLFLERNNFSTFLLIIVGGLLAISIAMDFFKEKLEREKKVSGTNTVVEGDGPDSPEPPR
ncbi:MAG: signal peptidase I [Promethearchaeota archaeon]